MSLYYLINQFGGQYVLGFVIVAMTLHVVNAISDSDFKFWQMALLTVLWPVVLPIVFVAALAGNNLRYRWERFKRHRAN